MSHLLWYLRVSCSLAFESPWKFQNLFPIIKRSFAARSVFAWVSHREATEQNPRTSSLFWLFLLFLLTPRHYDYASGRKNAAIRLDKNWIKLHYVAAEAEPGSTRGFSSLNIESSYKTSIKISSVQQNCSNQWICFLRRSTAAPVSSLTLVNFDMLISPIIDQLRVLGRPPTEQSHRRQSRGSFRNRCPSFTEACWACANSRF